MIAGYWALQPSEQKPLRYATNSAVHLKELDFMGDARPRKAVDEQRGCI
jgi:hypothetical protein